MHCLYFIVLRKIIKPEEINTKYLKYSLDTKCTDIYTVQVDEGYIHLLHTHRYVSRCST